ncbi:hypothetical protein RvY_02290 [Ramazzottius varieornatus]|uniref:HTH CENPB-type domain-containing protein n=1 Tax=Ramazzottius varieornatus TaxID=947166 RepID=A0A1D1UJ84_RAMVA|nr:hypothetical protein RvY_02290 [Ramazzottius varieornatus]
MNKQREKILALLENTPGKSFVSRKRKFDIVANAAMKYHEDSVQKGFPVSFTDLQEESKLLANNLKVQNSCGSAGWVANVLKSNQSQTVGLQGGEMGSDPEVTEKWITEDLPQILQGYKNADIFNCDETGSYLRSTPRKHF